MLGVFARVCLWLPVTTTTITTITIKQYKNPIEAGQPKDASKRDVRIMKQRAHALNTTLEGFVQVPQGCLVEEVPGRLEG